MTARHFPYQHPTFGTVKNPLPASAWKRSVYYWWWEYLRRHEGYKRTCRQGGKGKYAKLYADFGDVHATDCKAWWKQHGEALFSEPIREKLFSEVRGQIDDNDLANPNLLFIQVPLKMPVRLLTQKFAAMMKKHHQGKQGIRYARDSHAKYPVFGQPNTYALEETLKVYDYRVAHPKLKLWEVAMVLDLHKSFKQENNPAKLRDGDDEKNVMAATVSRYLKKAKAMIENAGLGRFPDTSADKTKSKSRTTID